MSGLPIFADPTTSVVYHTVPSANVGGSGQGVGGAGGHSQQQLPPTVAMMVVQNSSQPRQDSQSNMPLPPGMEIVLGDKKYKVQYQSYEMTREKATEYIAKCTGTPYSRMSAPPDPESFYRAAGAAGVSRSEGVGGLTAASLPTTADPLGVKPAARPASLAGDRGTMRMSSTSTASEDRYQRLKTPDEVYTTITPAAAGLPPEMARGAGVLPQQRQQLPKVPEQLQVVTTESTSYQAAPFYAPPPKDNDQQQQNMGYFWEDGVWKVWQADSGKTPASAPGEAPTAASKLPPPLPVQQSQPPQPSYASQLQPERSQYQYQYQYQYPQQQQQPTPQQPPQPPSLVATSTTLDPPSYLPQYSQAQHQPPQPPPARGPPPQPTGVIQRHASPSSSNISGAAGIDPMMQRYMI